VLVLTIGLNVFAQDASQSAKAIAEEKNAIKSTASGWAILSTTHGEQPLKLILEKASENTKRSPSTRLTFSHTSIFMAV
jgi:hypothetical protein